MSPTRCCRWAACDRSAPALPRPVAEKRPRLPETAPGSRSHRRTLCHTAGRPQRVCRIARPPGSRPFLRREAPLSQAKPICPMPHGRPSAAHLPQRRAARQRAVLHREAPPVPHREPSLPPPGRQTLCRTAGRPQRICRIARPPGSRPFLRREAPLSQAKPICPMPHGRPSAAHLPQRRAARQRAVLHREAPPVPHREPSLPPPGRQTLCRTAGPPRRICRLALPPRLPPGSGPFLRRAAPPIPQP